MEEEEIDTKETFRAIKKIYNKLTLKDIVIIALFLLLMLMYIIHTSDIISCNNYYQEILRENAEPLRELIFT